MFRYITAFLLLAAFAAQTFQRVAIVLDYYTHPAAYARNCENKARPMMHCNGRCQMMKKLKQEEKKDQDNPTRKAEHKNEVISSKSSFATVRVNSIPYHHVFHLLLTSGYPADRSLPVFHPPALA
jgi:hypothetical protein